MSILKPGTVCIAVDGCPENIGLLVEVVEYVGRLRFLPNVYRVKTLSGRTFHQVSENWRPVKTTLSILYAQRHQLKPLPEVEAEDFLMRASMEWTLVEV